MAWNPNIPAAGNLLATDQANIQGNFAAIATVVNPTAGSQEVILPEIPVTPAAVAATLQMFVQNDPASGNTPQLFVQRQTGSADNPTLLNFTGSNKTAASGWTYLPSGLELFWGTLPGALSPVNVAFADGGFDNACFSVVVTPTQAGTKNWCDVNTITPTGFVFESFDANQHASVVSFNYIAIGY